MKLRNWLLLIALSALSCLAAFLLYPKASPAARWQQNIDRDAAIAIAKQAALNFGVEGNWEDSGFGLSLTDVSTEYGPRRELYLATEPNGVGQPHFTPLTMEVKLLEFKTRRRVTAVINSKGKLQEFSLNDPNDRKPNEDNQPQAEKVSDADTQVAETAIKALMGDGFAAVKFSDASVTRQGSRFIWKAEDSRMKLLAKAVVRDGKLKQASLEHEFTKKFDAEFDARRSTLFKVLSNSEAGTIWLPIFLIAIFYFIGLALKRIQHKQALIFTAVTFVVISIYHWSQGVNISLDEGSSLGGNYWLAKLLSWLFFLVGMAAIAGSLYFVWAAGQSLAIRIPNRPTISIELVLKGKLLTKPVASSIAAGLLSGGIIFAIPVLLAASGLFSGMELDANELEDYFASPVPAAGLMLHGLQYLTFVQFGFMAMLVLLYVKHKLLARALVFIVIVLGLLGVTIVNVSVAGLVATALLVSLALTIIYFRADLLAVLLSVGVAQGMLGAATMLAQPAASLKSAAWRAIGVLVVSTVVALIGAWKFRDVTEEETAIPPQLLEARDERERLRAEFSVAQRAQQQMLPDAPPQVPGLEIAAICIPSKEVGGDLYDFLPLSDGRLGIVVADVSGKGVPASLYMTLTKGLLVSVSETTSDPGEILREVNRHLYEVCRRKMFVTLFLGVIDPATKRLTYARAGHNPTVFRRPAGETKLLSAGGIGLGLNRGKIFDQSLKVETIQLAANDKLYFYSDGITEAMNPKNEEYGEERLMELAERLDSVGANEARDVVLTDVKEFLGSNQPQDDQTLVVIRVT
ncbi:MAG: PP2C family protein-serine/threonine phosphatase [Blastocatellia bacterium]